MPLHHEYTTFMSGVPVLNGIKDWLSGQVIMPPQMALSVLSGGYFCVMQKSLHAESLLWVSPLTSILELLLFLSRVLFDLLTIYIARKQSQLPITVSPVSIAYLASPTQWMIKGTIPVSDVQFLCLSGYQMSPSFIYSFHTHIEQIPLKTNQELYSSH